MNRPATMPLVTIDSIITNPRKNGGFRGVDLQGRDKNNP